MTRKDYILLANALKIARAQMTDYDSATHVMYGPDAGRQAALQMHDHCVREIAMMFDNASYSSRFRIAEFLKLSGVV